MPLKTGGADMAGQIKGTGIRSRNLIKRNIYRAVDDLCTILNEPGLDEAALAAKVLDTAAKLAALACIISSAQRQSHAAQPDMLD